MFRIVLSSLILHTQCLERRRNNINTAKCIKEASAGNRWCDEVMIEIIGKKKRKLRDKAIKESFNRIMWTNQCFVNHCRAAFLTESERDKE